jgi:hypothetical protein
VRLVIGNLLYELVLISTPKEEGDRDLATVSDGDLA